MKVKLDVNMKVKDKVQGKIKVMINIKVNIKVNVKVKFTVKDNVKVNFDFCIWVWVRFRYFNPTSTRAHKSKKVRLEKLEET